MFVLHVPKGGKWTWKLTEPWECPSKNCRITQLPFYYIGVFVCKESIRLAMLCGHLACSLHEGRGLHKDPGFKNWSLRRLHSSILTKTLRACSANIWCVAEKRSSLWSFTLYQERDEKESESGLQVTSLLAQKRLRVA